MPFIAVSAQYTRCLLEGRIYAIVEVGFAGISGGWFAEVDLRKEDRDSMVQYLYPSGVTSCEEQKRQRFQYRDVAIGFFGN